MIKLHKQENLLKQAYNRMTTNGQNTFKIFMKREIIAAIEDLLKQANNIMIKYEQKAYLEFLRNTKSFQQSNYKYILNLFLPLASFLKHLLIFKCIYMYHQIKNLHCNFLL